MRKFVDDFHATDKKLSVLVNNAGTLQNFKDTRRQYTKDNFELTMGINHIGNTQDNFSLEFLLIQLKMLSEDESFPTNRFI